MNDASGFFDVLESRATRAKGPRCVIWIRVQGYTAKLVFHGIEPDGVMRANLRFLAIEPQADADETVYVWKDDLDALMAQSMIPEERRFIHYHQSDDYHVLFPGEVRRMAVRDNNGHRTFVCFERGVQFPEAYINKPFVNELQWWLWDRFLLLHGAAVGAGGAGALIAAPSGKGKSTLALACLLEGMEFVAEDYVLVDRVGPAVGHPILGTGFMTAETLELLPDFKRSVLYHATLRDKYLVDLAAHGGSFADDLPLRAMIYPVIAHSDVPSIEPAVSVKPFMAAITTTAKQVKSQERFADSFKILFKRFKGIPAFQMRLSEDPAANARALRAFLLGLNQGR